MLFCEKRCLGHCLIKEFRNCIFKGTAFHRLVLEVVFFFFFFFWGGGGGRIALDYCKIGLKKHLGVFLLSL